jgi:hypothetical protein
MDVFLATTPGLERLAVAAVPDDRDHDQIVAQR